LRKEGTAEAAEDVVTAQCPLIHGVVVEVQCAGYEKDVVRLSRMSLAGIVYEVYLDSRMTKATPQILGNAEIRYRLCQATEPWRSSSSNFY
jgi:hypothetical protein